MTKSLGMIFLSIFLITLGVCGLTGASVGIVLPILAIIAGVLILLGR